MDTFGCRMLLQHLAASYSYVYVIQPYVKKVISIAHNDQQTMARFLHLHLL